MTISEYTFPIATHRIGDLGSTLDEVIMLDASNSDAGSSPTSRFRPGNVMVLETGTQKYREANDPAADQPGVASAQSGGGSGFPSGGTTFSWRYKGGLEKTVTNTTGTGTVADWVTDLTADAQFAHDLEADNNGGELRIRSRRGGSSEYFEITTGTLNAAAGFPNNSSFAGSDVDVRITDRAVDLADDNGVARDMPIEAAQAGQFKRSELIVGGTKGASLPAHVEAVLLQRGSVLE